MLASRLASIATLELFPDEALYVWLGAAEPFGFSPHPPGTNLLARAGMALLGHSEEGVRALFLVLATLTPVLVWLLGRATAGRTAGMWAALAALCMPIYAAFGSICTPDAPQLFVWSAALPMTWKALQSGRTRWWAAAGATIGLGLFVKYILVLWFPSLLVFLLLSPTGRRRHLRSPGPYVAAAAAFAVFAPAFLWNQSAAGWTALSYHLEDRQSFTLPSTTAFLVYQGLHALYVSPILYGLALAGMAWAGVQGVRRGDERLLFLFSFSAVMWTFFAAISTVTERELSREQWDAPAYVTALIAAALMLQEKAAAVRPQSRRRWRILAAAGPALGLLLYAAIGAEGRSGRLTAALGRAPLYANFRGWSAMAAAADQALAGLPVTAPPPFFLGNSFVEACQFSFYTKTRGVRLITLDNDANDRFGLTPLLRREGLNQGEMDRMPGGTDAVFASASTVDPRNPDPKDTRARKLGKFFKRVEPLPDAVTEIGGRPGRRAKLFLCGDLKR